MAAIRDRVMASLRLLKSRPWPLSTAVAPRLDLCQPVEEEMTPYYNPSCFYPAHLGDILHQRYQLATKLGFGTSSTVWLARDLNQWLWSEEKYFAVKIKANTNHIRMNAPDAELDTLTHISKANPQHKGWHFVRHLVDSFTLEHFFGNHLCLVFEPLREPLWLYRERFIGNAIPSDVLKVIIQMILHGLDYLHSECRVIHTDLKPDNIMVKIEDTSILNNDARNEFENPLPQKICKDGRTIYLSRNNYGPPRRTTGVVRITDFDLAVRGDLPNSGCIQAEVYRAPEVIIDAGYTYSADIWSLGVMLWDLLEGKKLFKASDPFIVKEYNEPKHLAHITELLGPAPREILSCGRRASIFYGPDGVLKDPGTGAMDTGFETTLSNIKGEEKRVFIKFVKRMIKWQPEERSTAKELLDDPWLYSEFPQD